MKITRKVLALVATLAVCGSVGAYAATNNLSGSQAAPNSCPQNAAVKAVIAQAASCPQSGVPSAVQAALNQAKSGTGPSSTASNAVSKSNATTTAVKAAQSGNNSYVTVSSNCPKSSVAAAAAGQSCKTNSCAQNVGCKSNSCTNGATCPQTNCTQGSNCGKVIVYGSSNGNSAWINNILNSICGKGNYGTSTGTASKPSASTSVQASKPVSKPASSQAATGSSYSAFQNEVLRLVNVERAKNGLGALSMNSALAKTATLKSQDMAKNNYFSHTSPTYGSPFDMMKQFGISYRTAGENIAMGQTSPAQVMNGWMNSPGHRANILNGSFTKIGVGVAQNANGQYYWTQQFIG